MIRDEEHGGPANGLTPVVLRLHLGRPYRYSRGGLYAPLFFVTCAQSDTEKVCYVGLDGPDRGRRFVCSEIDWLLRFTLVELVEPPESPRGADPRPPGRVAGKYSAGSGV